MPATSEPIIIGGRSVTDVFPTLSIVMDRHGSLWFFGGAIKGYVHERCALRGVAEDGTQARLLSVVDFTEKVGAVEHSRKVQETLEHELGVASGTAFEMWMGLVQGGVVVLTIGPEIGGGVGG